MVRLIWPYVIDTGTSNRQSPQLAHGQLRELSPRRRCQWCFLRDIDVLTEYERQSLWVQEVTTNQLLKWQEVCESIARRAGSGQVALQRHFVLDKFTTGARAVRRQRKNGVWRTTVKAWSAAVGFSRNPDCKKAKSSKTFLTVGVARLEQSCGGDWFVKVKLLSGMVNFCCVPLCHSRSTRDEASFHRFPSKEREPERHVAWVRAIRRENFVMKEHTHVCGLHFPPSAFKEDEGGNFFFCWRTMQILPSFRHGRRISKSRWKESDDPLATAHVGCRLHHYQTKARQEVILKESFIDQRWAWE